MEARDFGEFASLRRAAAPSRAICTIRYQFYLGHPFRTPKVYVGEDHVVSIGSEMPNRNEGATAPHPAEEDALDAARNSESPATQQKTPARHKRRRGEPPDGS